MPTLSACSSVLKSLLIENPHLHPLIYLRGIYQQELESTLQFMYFGEVNSYQSNIQKLLDAAKSLQINPLAETILQVCPEKQREYKADDEIGNSCQEILTQYADFKIEDEAGNVM